MSPQVIRRVTAALCTSVTLLLAVLAAAPQASAATIYACVKKGGSARIYAKKPKCKKGETRLSWNTTGPAGGKGSAGSPGAGGAAGKDGAPGQPQTVAAFSGAELGTISNPFHSTETRTSASLLSLAGVSVRIKCEFIELGGFALELEAIGPNGTHVDSGVLATAKTGKPPTDVEPSIFNTAVVPAGTPFAMLSDVGASNEIDFGYVNSWITTATTIVVLDAYTELNGVESEKFGCSVLGMAYAIPT